MDPPGGTSGSQQMFVEEEDMEKFWMQVERTAFRVERVVPLFPETPDEDTVELQRLVETYRQGVRAAHIRAQRYICICMYLGLDFFHLVGHIAINRIGQQEENFYLLQG